MSNRNSTKKVVWIVFARPGLRDIRAVYTRENKPRLTLPAAYVSRERNYLYEYKLPGQDKPRLEKAVNVDFVPFIRGVRGLRKPRPELAAAYFPSYKRPYCFILWDFSREGQKNRKAITREKKYQTNKVSVNSPNYFYELFPC